jgi:predicted metal-dependent phosphoesterase TrpH
VNTLINADLHCHSVVSDGTLTPEALAQRAKANGVELWALTDHDELGGQDRAIAAAREAGLPYLTGTEVSVTFAGITVHIVGLGMDHTHPALLDGLRATRGGREQRAREMSDDLARVHFARYLVEIGVSKDTNEVFRKYITEGKPGFVPHRWATLADAVGWITQSGGVAVIAHPGRYKLTPNEEFALFTEFKAHGGQGVEVMTGAHGQADYAKYAGYCQEFGLAASRGSDFHSPEESHTDLGQLPDLPGSVTPVWELLQSRILQ